MRLALASLALAILTVSITFVIARWRGKYDTIDTAWGLGFAGIAILCFTAGAANVVTVCLTVVWGVRLAVHLHRRNAGKPEDARYAEMLRNGGSRPALRMFVRVYLTQALVLWFVSLPIQFSGTQLGVYTAVGAALWLVGFGFETVGDEQLRRFTADPANKNKVLDSGLWRYTRHPNYFGDACLWWGLYVTACQSGWGALTILSPVLLTWLLARGTGKPLLEKNIGQRRPGYEDYIRRTSGFFPLPPRRSNRENQ